MKDIAVRAADFRGTPLAKAYFRKGEFLKLAERALFEHAHVPLFENEAQRSRCRMIKALRDVLIHHDGQLDHAPSSIAALSALELAELGIQTERNYTFVYLVPTESFVETVVSFAYETVHSLAKRTFEAIHPRPRG